MGGAWEQGYLNTSLSYRTYANLYLYLSPITIQSEETLPAGPWSRPSTCRRRSVTSAESSNNGDDISEKQEEREYFPATRLFEYQWPLGEEPTEHYMLQEQVAEYLDIRGIQRKYPGVCVVQVCMHV